MAERDRDAFAVALRSIEALDEGLWGEGPIRRLVRRGLVALQLLLLGGRIRNSEASALAADALRRAKSAAEWPDHERVDDERWT